jgi:maltooligosyltrehalose trehalohydrolase
VRAPADGSRRLFGSTRAAGQERVALTEVDGFVDACHARDPGVVLDVVYNHVGIGNRLAEFGPYFTTAHSTPWGDAVNLNQPGSDEVRAFIVDNALMWLRDYHLDGLRLDVVHALADNRAVQLLEQLASAVHALSPSVNRELVLIAESDANDPRLVTPSQAGGYGLSAQWSDDFHHAVHAVLTGERQGVRGLAGCGGGRCLRACHLRDDRSRLPGGRR